MRPLAPVLALVAGLSASPVQAQVNTLFSSGLWSAYGGLAPDRRPVCGITTVGAEGRRIAIEQFAGETGLEVVFEKPTWSIPEGTTVDIVVAIDGAAGHSGRATGSDKRMVMAVPFEASVGLMRGVRYGQQIRAYFPSGNEPHWTGGLRGSSATIDAFNQCRMGLAPGAPTQPYRPAQGAPTGEPSQPFKKNGTAL